MRMSSIYIFELTWEGGSLARSYNMLHAQLGKRNGGQPKHHIFDSAERRARRCVPIKGEVLGRSAWGEVWGAS
jgi:hypothetical protein